MSQVLIIALAAASLWKLAVSDRVTQWLRFRFVPLARRLGWFGYHLEYMVGCARCFPFWASLGLYAGRDIDLVHDATVILAACFAAYAILRYLQETGTRDWPRPYEWPPERPPKGQ